MINEEFIDQVSELVSEKLQNEQDDSVLNEQLIPEDYLDDFDPDDDDTKPFIYDHVAKTIIKAPTVQDYTVDVVDDSTITNAKMADDSIKQAELDTEIVTLAFGAADTTKTATVTTGSIILGHYASAYTTPAASWLKLEISGTTLTGTLTAAPGAGNALTITVVLLKV